MFVSVPRLSIYIPLSLGNPVTHPVTHWGRYYLRSSKGDKFFAGDKDALLINWVTSKLADQRG